MRLADFIDDYFKNTALDPMTAWQQFLIASTANEPSPRPPAYLETTPATLANLFTYKFIGETLRVLSEEEFALKVSTLYELATANFYAGLTAFMNAYDAYLAGTDEKETVTENGNTNTTSGDTSETKTSGNASTKAEQPNTVSTSTAQNSGTTNAKTNRTGNETRNNTTERERKTYNYDKIRVVSAERTRLLNEFYKAFDGLWENYHIL